MKISLMLLAATLLAGHAHAADSSVSAPGLSATGGGAWEAICHVLANGEQKSVILNTQHSGYSDPRLTRAECSYRAGLQSELVVTVAGAETCPFAGASAEACTLSAPKGKRGSFTFRASQAR